MKKQKKINIKLSIENDSIYCVAAYNKTRTRFPIQLESLKSKEKLSVEIERAIRILINKYGLESLKGSAMAIRTLTRTYYDELYGDTFVSLGNYLTYNQFNHLRNYSRGNNIIENYIEALKRRNIDNSPTENDMYDIDEKLFHNLDYNLKALLSITLVLKEFEFNNEITLAQWIEDEENVFDLFYSYLIENQLKFQTKFKVTGLNFIYKKEDIAPLFTDIRHSVGLIFYDKHL